MSNFHSGAPEPSRSSGTITLTWGIFHIPLAMYAGTEDTSLGRKEFVNGDTSRPAGRAVIDKSTGQVVESSDVVRMAEASDGTFVVLTDDEIATCTGVRNKAEIITFIKNEDAAYYAPMKLMQVRPKRNKGIPDPVSSKVFSLLVTAMTDKGVSILVKVATRGPAQYAILTATGDLIFVHSTDAVRKPLVLPMVPVTQDELEAANQLIETIGVSAPTFLPDENTKAITDWVNKKVAAGDGFTAPKDDVPLPLSGVDMMETLIKSIEATQRKDHPSWGAPNGSRFGGVPQPPLR